VAQGESRHGGAANFNEVRFAWFFFFNIISGNETGKGFDFGCAFFFGFDETGFDFALDSVVFFAISYAPQSCN